MTVLRARYARIRNLTASLLSRHDVRGPWVDVARIVSENGIDLKVGDLGDVSGLLMRQGSRTIIGVNGEQAPVRQRFTMAHELGHYFLHDGLTSHRDVSFRVNYRDRTSSEATDVEEIEANSFAACLLMPRPFLDGVGAADAIGDDEAVSGLAGSFFVSGHAMSLRLVNEYGRYSPF